MNFWKKCLFEFINLILNNQIGLTLLGKVKAFDAVFVMYPADQQFADYFTFRFRQKRIAWSPFIVGMIIHPTGRKTLMFAISSFIDKGASGNHEEMRRLYFCAETIKKRLCAKTLHFAGTLPGLFTQLRVHRGDDQKNERAATVQNVVQAILRLRLQFGHTLENPVIVLGNRGYVGSRIAREFECANILCIGIDIDTTGSRFIVPAQSHIIVNVTRPGVITEYIEQLNSNSILLNEVYPPPNEEVLSCLKERGVHAFHVAGVHAKTIPLFPDAYCGAVPCCAALFDEAYRVKIVEM